ncbi:PBP1A family penicillin-binding protein [Thalassobaculum sp. OXR-137]|uniref:transglycosylase domain-containing protein n=1 Tax=Thalassobaculum sp. OXR-137 TaxID=3100173 RepID=UPI002AC9B128|nr:PBP1A family penicillin-binding protein [Thalassobaculum sp. OXR-137]WPZ35298.1 PBP1A family penicillin-binding protein [Thalassobaculum sp. OXR-137]
MARSSSSTAKPARKGKTRSSAKAAGSRAEPHFGGARKGKGPAKAASAHPGARRKRSAGRGSTRRSGGARRSLLGRLIRPLLKWGFLAAFWGGIVVAGILVWHAFQLPDITDLDRYTRPGSVRMTASEGGMFASYGPLHGDPVTVGEMSPHLPAAVIAIEDRRFPYHFGVDPIGLARAMAVNLWAGRVVQGGSTLTQQLAKNVFLTHDRSLSRKIQELLLAFWLEREFTKDEILSIYLNRVYFGAGAYGVDAAARKYFSKSARDLTLGEAALLAGMLKGPSRYSPAADPDLAQRRTAVVLNAMADIGYINPETARQVAADPYRLSGPVGRGAGHRYFSDWIYDQVPSFVGAVSDDLSVATTLDLRLQSLAEQAVRDGLARGGAMGVGQAALVALDPHTGAVRAMVGGADFQSSQFNRAVQALRQPGSLFKPVVFLAALEQGWQPGDLINDTPITVSGWSPGNFDGKYDGVITLTEALAESRNAATIRLQEMVGRGKVRDVARRLGFSDELTPGPSLGLGVDEMSPLDVAGIYATFANGGRPVTPHGIQEIRGRGGATLYRLSSSGLPSQFSGPAAATLTAMMMETVTGGTGHKAALDRPVAGKTGTSQNYRDAWFAGFTADLVAVVWIGNDNGAAMKKVTGGGLPAEIFHDFMTAAHAGLPRRALLGR